MWLIPTLVAARVTDISIETLRALGVRGLIFDLDNTLMAPRSGRLDADISQWLAVLAAEGFQLACVSNNKRAAYCQSAQETLSMPVFGHARKPFGASLAAAVAQMGLSAHETLVVGDRPLTDIWGGRRIGAQTALVKPLMGPFEPPAIRFLRWMERRVVRVS
ncbi:MAG: YqeG family HAD IIIA-type phosphatase [Vampirovibrionales bacterium]|nr:YqeG family HAD IIIA-type phosphatase [Vampirovibrionales bacterium]